MPRAYAYIRVSTEDQAQSGLGMKAQLADCKAYYEYDLRKREIEWGQEWGDRAVSGGRPLRQRPQGRQLDQVLERGDVVVFAKLDRGFRDTVDLLETVKAWEARGITCVFLDIKVDTSSDVGRLILTVMGAVATFERARITARVREGLAQLALQGLPKNGKTPYPWKLVRLGGHGRKVKRKLVVCEFTRKIGARIVGLRKKGLTHEQIYWLFIREGVRDRFGKEINEARVRRWFTAETQLRLQEGVPRDGETDPPPDRPGTPPTPCG